MKKLILALACLFYVIPCWARVITVDNDGPADFNNIQAAINDANDGDTVLVADGVYTGDGNRDINFLGKAITVRSENGPTNCIIDCQGSLGDEHIGFYVARNSHYCFADGLYCVVDGFTITGAMTTAYWGGGATCSACAIIRNCIFRENYSQHFGAAVSAIGPYCPVVINCTFVNNASETSGGAVAACGDIILRNCISWANSMPDLALGHFCYKGVGRSHIYAEFSILQSDWYISDIITENCLVMDPCFADPCNSDYHLKSEAGRWDPNSQTWVQDDVTSPAIDAGDPNSDWSQEPCPNGGRINMGAYGGTNQASKSLGCFPIDLPDYDLWINVGCPPCWCYPRQCHGDADDTKEFIMKKGYYYAHFNDLNLLLSAWNIMEPPISPGIFWPDPKICADFGHDTEIITKKGCYRVHFKDLNILLANWNVREPPQGLGIDPNCLDCP